MKINSFDAVPGVEIASWNSAIGASIALVGTFLPWLASGAVDRSSYELLDIVERLGFSPDGLVGLALTVWPLAPLGLAPDDVSNTRTGLIAGSGGASIIVARARALQSPALTRPMIVFTPKSLLRAKLFIGDAHPQR